MAVCSSVKSLRTSTRINYFVKEIRVDLFSHTVHRDMCEPVCFPVFGGGVNGPI